MCFYVVQPTHRCQTVDNSRYDEVQTVLDDVVALSIRVVLVECGCHRWRRRKRDEGNIVDDTQQFLQIGALDGEDQRLGIVNI